MRHGAARTPRPMAWPRSVRHARIPRAPDGSRQRARWAAGRSVGVRGLAGLPGSGDEHGGKGAHRAPDGGGEGAREARHGARPPGSCRSNSAYSICTNTEAVAAPPGRRARRAALVPSPGREALPEPGKGFVHDLGEGWVRVAFQNKWNVHVIPGPERQEGMSGPRMPCVSPYFQRRPQGSPSPSQ